MSNQDLTNKYSNAYTLRENKRFSRESDENLSLENGSDFESESESIMKAKKVRVSDTPEENESNLTLEMKANNGFHEKTVSRENDSSLEDESGSCIGVCSSSIENSEAIAFINADQDAEERVRKIDIDLNFPPLEAIEDEGFSRENYLSLNLTSSNLEESYACVGGRRRYTREEKGKGKGKAKMDDGWLSLATAWSLDLDKRRGKLWIGP